MKTFIFILAILFGIAMPVGAEEPMFSVEGTKDGFVLTCLRDTCVIKNLTIDRNKRKGQVAMVIASDVEDFNFGKRSAEQIRQEHVRGFVVDLPTGGIIEVQCKAPAMNVVLYGLALEAQGKPSDQNNDMCLYYYDYYIKLQFSNKVSIAVKDAFEININDGEAMFKATQN